MLHMVIALLPATAFAVVAFGLAALATILAAILACVLAERLAGPPSTLADGSALLTGLLLGMSLPPALPLWMVAVGGAIATLVGRRLFGGLGGYAFQPVLVGWIILDAAFPAAMAHALMAPFEAGRLTQLPPGTLALPFMRADAADAPGGALAATTGAEPAAWLDLFFGNTAGATGETSAVLLLLGGLYLVARRVVDWRIPAALLACVALSSSVLHGLDPSRHTAAHELVSGGLMLGAWFLATDPVGSPLSRRGKWIFGLSVGALAVVIRQSGGQPEGILYAILLGNALTPHIDRWTQPGRALLRGTR
jgi:electron transport complex protein RnfD